MTDAIILESSRARLVVEPDAGGRMASLSVDGAELLVDRTDDPITWGSYPMIPFAGRIRNGVFSFGGARHEMPTNAPPHALHGYGFLQPWAVVDEATIRWDFGEPWPFAGWAEQRFDLTADRLLISFTVHAGEAQPMLFGIHPWFRRSNAAGELSLEFDAAEMYVRDEVGMPDWSTVAPPPGPWDDCFRGLSSDPVLRWGDLAVALSSNTDHWVVFDEPAHAMCVEPQTGPPDVFNGPDATSSYLDSGASRTLEFALTWA